MRLREDHASIHDASKILFRGGTLPELNEQPGLRSDDRRSGGYYLFAGRLNAGATWRDAHAELASTTTWLAEKYPAANGKFWEVGFHDLGPLGCSTK